MSKMTRSVQTHEQADISKPVKITFSDMAYCEMLHPHRSFLKNHRHIYGIGEDHPFLLTQNLPTRLTNFWGIS